MWTGAAGGVSANLSCSVSVSVPRKIWLDAKLLAWLDDPHLRGSSFVLTDNLGRKFSESVFTGYDLGFLGYSDCRDFRDFTLYFRDFRQDFMTFCTPDFRGSWPLEQTYFLRDD